MEFIDNYEHIDPTILYTIENVPTKDTQDNFLEICVGCKCPNECRIETNCSCLANKINYTSTHTFEDNLVSIQNNYTLIKKDTPIYECNSLCKCSIFCTNRLVQFGPRNFLKVAACKTGKTFCTELEEPDPVGKGFGLFTMQPIRSGNFVCEYAGEIISQNEANERFTIQEQKRLSNYIFCVNEDFGQTIIKTFVDPTKFGNIGRYLNHSCNPNCEVIPVRVQCIIPKLCVFAKCDIPAKTEVTIDYSPSDNPNHLTASDGQNRKECLCGFVNCRKLLPFELIK